MPQHPQPPAPGLALTSPGFGENARPNDYAMVNNFTLDTRSQENQYLLSGYSTVGGVLWSDMRAHLAPRQGAQALSTAC